MASHEAKKKAFKRKFISLDEKIKILDRFKNGEGSTAISKSLNLNEATVRTIIKNENKIRTSVSSGSSISAKRVARTRDVLMEKMEKALILWVEDCTNKRMPLDGNLIKHKALKIFKHLKDSGESSNQEPSSSFEFSASKGWFENFKKRFMLHNIKLQGESASADLDAAQKFPEDLLKIIQQKGYTSDQVFNADETGLLWKKMPKRTFISKNAKSAPGFKVAKDRLTVLLCSNASGDFISKPIVIYRALNPRAMKNKDKSNLPVFWRANKKAWVTAALFTDWFQNCFVPEVERYMKRKNLTFKILLILDNAPGHPKELSHPNVEIIYLPPNTTSIIQPQDQGIIATFKSYYIRRTFQHIMDRMESDTNMSVSRAWKEFSILECVEIIALSIKELKSSTLNACWKALWPAVVLETNIIPPIQNELDQILEMAHSIGGEGFTDMATDDLKELLLDEEMNEEDLLELTVPQNDNENDSEEDFSEPPKKFTLKTLQKGLEFGRSLESIIIDNDPLMERSAQFKRQLDACLAPYQEIFKKLQSECRQSLITDFLGTSEREGNERTSNAVRSEDIELETNRFEEISSDDDVQPIQSHRRDRILSDSDD